MKSKSILVLVTLLTLLGDLPLSAIVIYNLTDLGSGSAWSINNAGQAVGSFGLWEDGIVTSLGGTGKAINDAGQVAGVSGTIGFFWENGVTTIIGGYANGINDAGQVVGRDGFSAWKWDKTNNKTYLGNGMNDAYGINNSGQIAGMMRNASNQLVAALWNSSGNVIDLGTFGGYVDDPSAVNSNANGINEAGQVVGFARTAANDNYHAFLWDSFNGMVDLGILDVTSDGSYAQAINESGQVVGFASSANVGHDYHAFFWDNAQGMIDLNTLLPSNSGWDYLRLARGINDNGQIVGEGYINGQAHGFLLTIPEPSTLLLLGLGAVIVRRKTKTAVQVHRF